MNTCILLIHTCAWVLAMQVDYVVSSDLNESSLENNFQPPQKTKPSFSLKSRQWRIKATSKQAVESMSCVCQHLLSGEKLGLSTRSSSWSFTNSNFSAHYSWQDYDHCRNKSTMAKLSTNIPYQCGLDTDTIFAELTAVTQDATFMHTFIWARSVLWCTRWRVKQMTYWDGSTSPKCKAKTTTWWSQSSRDTSKEVQRDLWMCKIQVQEKERKIRSKRRWSWTMTVTTEQQHSSL